MIVAIPLEIEIRFAVAILVCLIGAAGSVAYVLTDQRRKAKKPIYASKAVILCLAIVIYVYALFGGDAYFIRSGWGTNIILIMLVSTLIANLISDWRKNDKR